MFVVFALPRSRTAWLSVFLGAGHDIGIECETPEDFAAKVGEGTCETGAAFAWRLIRQQLPDARFVVVHRDPPEVIASLARFGLHGFEAELQRRMNDLREIGAQPGTLNVDFADLARQDTCAAIYAHCHDRAMDLEHWRRLEGLNIQVDMGKRWARLQVNAPRIANLKAEVMRRLAPKGYSIALEPWSAAWWSEARPLAELHFEEVDGGVEANRSMNVDEGQMARLSDAGVLKLVTARLDGRMVGYYTWNVSLDVESAGLMIAQQGAWYVEEGHPRLAIQMFDASVSELRKLGVRFAYPHHRLQGRGANIGKFFKRCGAKPIQITYSLEL